MSRTDSRPLAAAALFSGVLGGVTLTLLLSEIPAWLQRFMLSPGGGALLTLLATGTIGGLTYSQANRRLNYERTRDQATRDYEKDRDSRARNLELRLARSEREESRKMYRYEEEKSILARLWLYLNDLESLVTIYTVELENPTDPHVQGAKDKIHAKDEQNIGYTEYAQYAILFRADSPVNKHLEGVRFLLVNYEMWADKAEILSQVSDGLGKTRLAVRERIKELRDPLDPKKTSLGW